MVLEEISGHLTQPSGSNCPWSWATTNIFQVGCRLPCASSKSHWPLDLIVVEFTGRTFPFPTREDELCDAVRGCWGALFASPMCCCCHQTRLVFTCFSLQWAVDQAGFYWELSSDCFTVINSGFMTVNVPWETSKAKEWQAMIQCICLSTFEMIHWKWSYYAHFQVNGLISVL